MIKWKLEVRKFVHEENFPISGMIKWKRFYSLPSREQTLIYQKNKHEQIQRPWGSHGETVGKAQ